MAAAGGAGESSAEKCCSDLATEDSSESDGETEPAKSFHRRISTNKEIKNSASIKEGYLMKQVSSFQRWKKRYFKLKGKKLYYAKDTKSVIFDEIELTDLSVAECSTKNVNHSFQVITPFRVLVLCAESRREMEEWISALKSAGNREFYEGIDHYDFLSGQHHWYAASHARPTYCNVCREALSGVTSHGLSCEVCKLKAHKKCAVKTANNCKWTTLASVGKEIIEDEDGNIAMPHQWLEGNLPVSAKCIVCDRTCGSVLRLQDWRCLWCRAMVHTQCKSSLSEKCPLGPCRVSVIPPTALNNIGSDDAWEASRPMGCSPLLVFVNSKSGDNQGVKFLRRFKQVLNPAQVFDLINGGPALGLNLFKSFNPFRILVCGGDGSIGWVLSEIDKLNMHNQCQLGVLPLGTGNDLARVLGWGSVCDDDTQLPQLLEKYEKATTKMLDRWSIMTYEGQLPTSRKLLHQCFSPSNDFEPISAYEDSVVAHLTKMLHSDQNSVVISSARVLCETVRDFVAKVGAAYETEGLDKDEDTITKKCAILNEKLDLLLKTLNEESVASQSGEMSGVEERTSFMSKAELEENENEKYSDNQFREQTEKSEKEAANALSYTRRKRARGNTFIQKEALMSRANSLKKAVRQIIEHAERAIDEQNAQTSTREHSTTTATSSEEFLQPTFTYTLAEPYSQLPDETLHSPECSYLAVPQRIPMAKLQVLPTIESVSGENSPCSSPLPPSPSSPSSSAIISHRPSTEEIAISPCHSADPSSPSLSHQEKQDLQNVNIESSMLQESFQENERFSLTPSPDYSSKHRESVFSETKRNIGESDVTSSPKKDISKSPTASRRISSGSTLKHAVVMAGRISSLAVPAPSCFQREKTKSPELIQKRELPIINPLVTHQTCTSEELGGGIISKVLLANADALCAAASPLMDSGDFCLDGFQERCVMNNYFGIGLDAKITLDFHNKREEHPEKCRSRTKNMMWYGVLGGKELLQQTYKNLEQRVHLECDGQRISLPRLQGIVVLNILSFAGGANFWGGTKEDDMFFAPSFDDKILEVVAVFGSVQMAASRIINLHRHRIAQCRTVTITILGDEGVPIQVDGEAWVQPPGIIKIIHKNRVQMLYRNRHLESSLKTWQEKQRYMMGSSKASATQGSPMSDDEIHLMVPFLEASALFIRSIKMAAIDHSEIEQQLYQLAAEASSCLDKIYSEGRISGGPSLRSLATDVFQTVKILYQETNVFINERSHRVQLNPQVEDRLQTHLGLIENELRKCSEVGGFICFHSPYEEQGAEKKRPSKGFNFKLKFKKQDRSKEGKAATPSPIADLPVVMWGPDEVVQWLEHLQLGEYKDNFLRHDIYGSELLHLERGDFKDLNITKVGHIKRLQQGIKDLALTAKASWEKPMQ